jgi:hypothetical protein
METKNTRAVVHGIPGEQARARGVLRAFLPLLGVVFLAGVLFGLSLPHVPDVVIGFGLLVVAGLLVWNVRDGLKNVKAFFKGARGEERVALLLEGLPAGFHVFHDFACASGDAIDHVVVSPAGLFAIETKYWEGEVTVEEGLLMVNGKMPTRSPIQQAKHSASLLAAHVSTRLATLPVAHAVVCFASNTFQPQHAVVDGVTVCNASELTAFIVGQGNPVSSDDCERLVKILEQKNA